MIPVISIVGRSGSGKTTLICNLIPLLKERGYRVATIKHDVHGFAMDIPGKDTYKHAQAGADVVVISSREKVAMLEKVGRELTLDEVIAKISDVDIIIVEGYKHNHKPKVEVFRSTQHAEPLCKKEDQLLAVVSDVRPVLGVPVFALSDYLGLVMYLEQDMRIRKQ